MTTDPDVTFTMSLTDAKRLQRILACGVHTIPSILVTESAQMVAFVNYTVERAAHADRKDFVDGVAAAIASLNDEVTGLDLWREHRGFDPTDQDPT